MNEQNYQHVFAFAIGPVQGFIAAGRKSSDLQYGSVLLSSLARAGAEVITSRYGLDNLIFPAMSTDDKNDTASVPNKIVAVIPDQPTKVGAEVEKAIRQHLVKLRDQALKRKGGKFNRILAEKQIDDLLEVYWVGVAYDGSNEGYVRARNLAEHLLSARKSTRNFRQAHGDSAPKSSIDGQRESVIHESWYPTQKDDERTKQEKAKKLFEAFGARPAERLSGVDLMKRLGGRGRSFPSTSDMAAKPFLKYVDNHDIKGDSQAMLQEIKQMLQDYDIDADKEEGALVYSSRLVEWVSDEALRKTVTERLEEILSDYADKRRPDPYYALLVADGDNMGKVIDHQKSIATHKELSAQLNRFAQKVAGIVEQHEGALIYAGGDDVMAYLPLHTVLKCAQKLADEFENQMKGFTSENNTSPTLSTGIVIAHHLTPLSDTLEKARQAERAAKSVTGKHALAITVSKRSGVDRTIRGKRKEMAERLAVMIGWRRNGDISAGTPYELHELHRLLSETEIPRNDLMEEALRIIDRKRESGGGEMSQEKREEIRKRFKDWFAQKELSLEEIAYEMIIAGQLAAAQDMAGIPQTESGGNS